MAESENAYEPIGSIDNPPDAPLEMEPPLSGEKMPLRDDGVDLNSTAPRRKDISKSKLKSLSEEKKKLVESKKKTKKAEDKKPAGKKTLWRVLLIVSIVIVAISLLLFGLAVAHKWAGAKLISALAVE